MKCGKERKITPTPNVGSSNIPFNYRNSLAYLCVFGLASLDQRIEYLIRDVEDVVIAAT